MKTLYIDETGDHSLSKIQKSYPIFVLCGIICDEKYHDGELTDFVEKLKLKHFGTTDIILHSKEMTHPQGASHASYVRFMDEDFRRKFYADFEKMLFKLDIKIVACVIMKNKHFAKYGLEAKDPYLLSFDNLLNRLVFELNNGQKGGVVAESRNGILDNQLELSYLTARIEGTNKVQASELKQKLAGSVKFSRKADNVAGIQIADMVATPIARHFLGKPERAGNQLRYESVFQKVRSVNGRWKNVGITEIPHRK